MATQWSRLHGEFYLRRKRDYGEVEDVEELTVVLWFRGIGQWRSVSSDLARDGHGFPVTVLAWKRTLEGEMARGRGSERGAGFHLGA